MTPAELRTWLANCTGKSMNFAPGYANLQGGAGVDVVVNGAFVRFLPITVARTQIAPGGGTFGRAMELKIANSVFAGRDGVYVSDAEKKCTMVNATLSANGIVVSGQFSGCTFSRCTVAGNEWVGHIYVKGSAQDNDPVAQARNFETACGGAANTAVGFRTAGLLAAPASTGYVIGTLDGGAWQWNWVTASNSTGYVVSSTIIPNASWVQL